VAPLRVGVAGLGAIAQLHLEAYAQVSTVSVVGGADPSADARARTASAHGIRCHASLGELLSAERPDLVCVLSSVNTHRPLVEEAASAGVAVFCEKPMAVSVDDALAMDEACRAADVLLAYGASYRFLGPMVEARRAIEEGRVGRVELIVETLVGGRGPAAQQAIGEEHYPAGGPGGTGMGLVDHGIHFFDLVPWLAGSPIVSALGRGNRSGSPLRPEFALLTLESGATGHLICHDGTWSTSLPNEGVWALGGSWDVAAHYAPAGAWARDIVEIHVFGTDGALRILPYVHHLFLSDADGLRELEVPQRPSPFHFGAQLEAVAAAVRNGTSPPVPAQAGIDALLVLEDIYRVGVRR
jgi:predicted dehydrogenase